MAAAGIWHTSIVAVLFLIGKFQWAPAHVYPNGIGKSFAIDTVNYQAQCIELARILRAEGVVAWATWPTQLHLRLYSLPLVPLSRWIDFNILVIEPVNLFCYLAILAMVFKIGRRLFDDRSGLIAAGVVALWPSLLLHTTQLLREPLLITAFLLFIWSVVELLEGELRLSRVLRFGGLSIVAVILIRIVRQPLWYLIVAAAGTAIVLLAIRAWREKFINRGAILFALLLIAVVIVTPRFQTYFTNQQELRADRSITHDEVQKMPLVQQIATSRRGFNFYYDDEGNERPALDASLIDPDVEVRSLGDVIRLVPRAIEVGLFAPFPNMWFRYGRQVGSGRLLAAVETLLIYVFEFLALFGFWQARRHLSAWFIAVFIAMGVVSLGLAVNNVGALYRLRYPFWILLVIIGTGGISTVVNLIKSKSPGHS